MCRQEAVFIFRPMSVVKVQLGHQQIALVQRMTSRNIKEIRVKMFVTVINVIKALEHITLFA